MRYKQQQSTWHREKFVPVAARCVVAQEPLQLRAATAHRDFETLAVDFPCLALAHGRIFWPAAALQPKTWNSDELGSLPHTPVAQVPHSRIGYVGRADLIAVSLQAAELGVHTATPTGDTATSVQLLSSL